MFEKFEECSICNSIDSWNYDFQQCSICGNNRMLHKNTENIRPMIVTAHHSFCQCGWKSRIYYGINSDKQSYEDWLAHRAICTA